MPRVKIEQKKCTRCGIVKPLDEFGMLAYRNILKSWCKECCQEYNRVQYSKSMSYKRPKVEKYINFKDGTKLPIYVINTLKEFSNCYIRKLTFKQETLEMYVGFKVSLRHPADGIGWVIERKQ